MMHYCLVLVQRRIHTSNSEVNGPPLPTTPVSPLQTSSRESTSTFRSPHTKMRMFFNTFSHMREVWVTPLLPELLELVSSDLRIVRPLCRLRDPTLPHQICGDVRSLLHSIFKDVSLMSARFLRIFKLLPRRFPEFTGPSTQLLELFPFILRTSRKIQVLWAILTQSKAAHSCQREQLL